MHIYMCIHNAYTVTLVCAYMTALGVINFDSAEKQTTSTSKNKRSGNILLNCRRKKLVMLKL